MAYFYSESTVRQTHNLPSLTMHTYRTLCTYKKFCFMYEAVIYPILFINRSLAAYRLVNIKRVYRRLLIQLNISIYICHMSEVITWILKPRFDNGRCAKIAKMSLFRLRIERLKNEWNFCKKSLYLTILLRQAHNSHTFQAYIERVLPMIKVHY